MRKEKFVVVAAHKGEVAPFLNRFRKINKTLFCDGENYLLLSGEGCSTYIENLIQLLKALPIENKENYLFVNLGFCGSLIGRTLGELCGVTESIHIENVADKEEPIISTTPLTNYRERTSFFSKNISVAIQPSCCLTLANRLETMRVREELLALFPHKTSVIVEKEFALFAECCEKMNLRYSALKIVSDIAGVDTDMVLEKQRTEGLAKKLWEGFYKGADFLKLAK